MQNYLEFQQMSTKIQLRCSHFIKRVNSISNTNARVFVSLVKYPRLLYVCPKLLTGLKREYEEISRHSFYFFPQYMTPVLPGDRVAKLNIQVFPCTRLSGTTHPLARPQGNYFCRSASFTRFNATASKHLTVSNFLREFWHFIPGS